MSKHSWFDNIRRSLLLPIASGVAAIIATIVVLVTWSVFFTRYYMLSRGVQLLSDVDLSYWVFLSFGYVSFVMIALVLLLFLISNVRQRLHMRQQTTFIDSVTHELKSPLASLQLCLETMEMRELTPDLQKKFVGMMRKDVDRLSKFIEHILDAGRLEHDNYDLKIQKCHVSEFIERNVQQICHRHRLQEGAIQPIISLDPERELTTDPIALDTILLNLLDNAVKYSPQKEGIELLIDEVPQGIRFQVKDKGMGLPKRQLKRIFRRFYRFKRDRQSAIRGTGLGLYVVDSLVSRIGGKITAFSEGEQLGSTFTVVLPWQLKSEAVIPNNQPPPKTTISPLP